MVKIKICGITKVEDALFCEQAGAEAIGLVFYPPSPRNVEVQRAREIAAALPPFITVVALFVNPKPSLVDAVITKVKPDCLQFHGEEDNAFCHSFNRKWFKSIAVKPGVDIGGEIARYPDSGAVLLDAWHKTLPGGSGTSFDWSLIPDNISKPLILAGGLNLENVNTAVSRVKPWAVDVSGGVESAPGVKDQNLIAKFISAIKMGKN